MTKVSAAGIAAMMLAASGAAAQANSVEMIAESLSTSRAYVQKELGAGATITFLRLYASPKGAPVICGNIHVRGSRLVSNGPQRYIESMAGLMFDKDVNAASKIPFGPQWQMWC